MSTTDPVHVEIHDDFVATIELCRPPHNFFSMDMIEGIGQALQSLDENPACRSAVLRAQGKNFCGGADFGGGTDFVGEGGRSYTVNELYDAAVAIFETDTPVVAAIQGAAIGGGLGLALSADFRIAVPESRFSANFARLGFHQGFGLSVTLPRLIGQQAAAELLYTGRRVKGPEAVELGLAEQLSTLDNLHRDAHEYARQIALSAPLAVREIRRTLRGDLAAQVREATDHELAVQSELQKTADFAEGTLAMSQRREPRFTGL